MVVLRPLSERSLRQSKRSAEAADRQSGFSKPGNGRIAVRAASRRANSSNRDKPSGPSTTASPSILKLLALITSAAAAIAASRTVQS
jgi:hypothetical protein